MPFVHITSLPFAHNFDAPAAIVAISEDFSTATGVATEHITVTWNYFRTDHYAVDAVTAAYQPRDSHPLLVDLLAPDFNSPEQVATMLPALAQSIAAQCGVTLRNVFINYRGARSGCVFDAGEVVHW